MKPIIFNGEMVRAILDGRKTQTRRVIKPQPEKDAVFPHGSVDTYVRTENANPYDDARTIKCPYGQPGDLLYVRETVSKVRRPSGKWIYRADLPQEVQRAFSWRPPIHMRRQDSRITLKITDVRVERVQEISEKDAIAEGIYWDDECPEDVTNGWCPGAYDSPIDSFKHLWDSINAKRGYSWKANPWVWCLTLSTRRRNKCP